MNSHDAALILIDTHSANLQSLMQQGRRDTQVLKEQLFCLEVALNLLRSAPIELPKGWTAANAI